MFDSDSVTPIMLAGIDLNVYHSVPNHDDQCKVIAIILKQKAIIYFIMNNCNVVCIILFV